MLPIRVVVRFSQTERFSQRQNSYQRILTQCEILPITLVEAQTGSDMNILAVFGDNVRHYRIERKLSQEAFAKKCGLHRTYISAVERHKRSISLNNIQKIADALNVDTYLLFLEPGTVVPRAHRHG